jgi:hypothetical protein
MYRSHKRFGRVCEEATREKTKQRKKLSFLKNKLNLNCNRKKIGNIMKKVRNHTQKYQSQMSVIFCYSLAWLCNKCRIRVLQDG